MEKIIRYVWIDGSSSENAIIPKCYQVCIMSAMVMNPDYQIVIHSNKPLLWDDLKRPSNIVNEIIPQRYMDLVNQLEIKRVAHKSDYIRYSILKEQGGIYSDTDIFMLKSLDDLLDYKVVLAREKPTTVCCAFIMAEAGHKLFDDIIKEYHNDYRGDEWLYNSQLMLRKYAKTYDDIKILEYSKGMFYPNWKMFPMSMFYDEHIINSKEDISKKFGGYAQHIWSSTPFGDRLKKYINENCIGIQDKNKDKSYIYQLIQFIYREYYKMIGETI